MATKRTVRVIRTWEQEVDAEYGDSDEMLAEKVTESWLDANQPIAETRVILEGFDSSFDTRQQLVCPNCVAGNLCPAHQADPYAEPVTDSAPDTTPEA